MAHAPGEPTGQPLYVLPGSWPGLVHPGNLDLLDRGAHAVTNLDGSLSTVRSMSFGVGGREILVPTAVGGRILTPQQAIAKYVTTGQHLGTFSSVGSANAYANALHQQQAALYTH